MIITKTLDSNRLMDTVKNYKSFFLVGCSECAALCGTGGEPQLDEMRKLLEGKGKVVTGQYVVKTGCQVLGTKTELKAFKETIDAADCILVMSCGAGTQTVVELFKDKAVCPTNDSLFLGNMTRMQFFDERCSLCGDCILEQTGGICPVTTCPKGILNGPCGGCKDGQCEVNPDIPCAWVRIYERMKKLGKLQEFCEMTIEAKDWSKIVKPKTIVAREKKNR
jgi:hypothetical protein